MVQVGGVNGANNVDKAAAPDRQFRQAVTDAARRAGVPGLAIPKTVLEGAANAHQCVDLKPSDRLLIITDKATSPIAKALEQTATATQDVKVLCLEDFGERPMGSFPDSLKAAIDEFKPTVSIFAACPQGNEVQMRRGMIGHLVTELKVRHAHMVFITEEIMEGAMRGNAQEVYALTTHVHELVKNARTITIKADNGTNLTAEFDPNMTWINSHPLIREQGKWGNLPNGEVFTCPLKVNGTIVVDGVLGDYLSPQFGILEKERALTIKIEDSRIVSIEGKNAEVVEAFKAYLAAGDENSNRVGEFAIGTNLGITRLIGNMLSDEKSPGFHMAFGDPYGNETGADWKSKTHIDVIPVDPNIEVDGKTIMTRGRFASELLEEVHLSQAARKVTEGSMGITNADRVLIFIDETSLQVAKALEQNLSGIENVSIVKLDGFRANGPLAEIPTAVKALIDSFKPTASIYVASGDATEAEFRTNLINTLTSVKARHAHMPGITPKLMRKALSGDPEDIAEFTMRVLKAMTKDKTKAHVTSANGTDLTIKFFEQQIAWVIELPIIRQPGTWAHLPGGRIYTCPEAVDGKLVIDGVIGGDLSIKHGVLGKDKAIELEISGGRIRGSSIKCRDSKVKADFEASISIAKDRNASRVGLVALGTNFTLDALSGDITVDRAAPFFQLGFGNPHQETTSAIWTSSSEVTAIITGATIAAGYKTMMEKGKYPSDLLAK